MHARGIHSYRQTDVSTADPKRLVIMCYQGAIDHLKIAERKNLEGRFEEKADALQKAHDFLDVLMQSLNFEKGGEIAKNLDSLYNYMTRRLLYAEANRDSDAVEEVIGMFEQLKEAWVRISYAKKESPAVDFAAHTADRSEGRTPSAIYGPHARV